MNDFNLRRTDPEVYNRWERFLRMEKLFTEAEEYVYNGMIARGVTINLIDEGVYSNQYKNVIIKVAEEFVAQVKEMTGYTMEIESIDMMADRLLLLYPMMPQIIVDTDYIPVTPFRGWKLIDGQRRGLSWWRSYYRLKHGGVNDFRYATLECCLNVMGALYILNCYSLKTAYGNLAVTNRSQHFRIGIPD